MGNDALHSSSKVESAWRKDGDWKTRYSKLYSSHHMSMQKEEEPRISFMTNDMSPFGSMSKSRTGRQDSLTYEATNPQYLTSILSHRSEMYNSSAGSQNMQSDNLGGHETLLLDMVRARSRELQEAQDQTLNLPQDFTDDQSNLEQCVHGLNFRMTERSVSRSRVSRMSTRRDMDIPSILAFTATTTPSPAPLENPAFQKVDQKKEEMPKWSIRRSVCPVCSQKWKDRSSICNVKYSGLKRSSMEFPSVIAPARLRTAITTGYVPRPALAAVDEELGINRRVFRSSSASWQLTRARRFRAPKPIMPSPEASRPPMAAEPLAQKDLDTRVSRFLTDEDVKLIW